MSSNLWQGPARSARSSSSSAISRMSYAAQLEAAGAPPEEVERARRLEATYGPTGTVAVARALGVERDERGPRGLGEAFFDYISRPGSAIVGGITGLLGIDRRTKEGETETGSGMDEAWDRMKKGLTGEEWYRSKEFGALQYEEDASLLEKGFKSSIGFVMDAALDPLTYVSGPGSIFGRVRGASLMDSAIFQSFDKPLRTGTRLSQILTDGDHARIIANSVSTRGTSIASLSALLEDHKILLKFSDPSEARRAIAARGPVSGFTTLDDLLRQASDTPLYIDDAGEAVGNALQLLSRKSLAWGTAGEYATRGYGAARKFLNESLGDDLADTVWKMLPADLQGGLRIRVPFARRDTELGSMPITVKVLGGGGQFVESLAPLRMVRDLTNAGRNWLRSAPGFGAARKHLFGKHGEWFTQMAKDVYGRKENGAVTYSNYASILEAFASKAAQEHSLNERLGKVAFSVANAIRRGRQDFGDVFLTDDGSRGLFQDYLSRLGRLDDEELAALSLPEQAAYQAVNEIHGQLDEVVEIIRDVMPDFTRLEAEFFPRVWELFTSYGAGGKGLKGLANQREAFKAIIGLDDNAVLRWFTPAEIFQRTGIEIFKVDPEQAIFSYLMATRKTLNEIFMQKELVNRGILVGSNILKRVIDKGVAANEVVNILRRFGQASEEIRRVAQGATVSQRSASERRLISIIGSEAFERARSGALYDFAGYSRVASMLPEDAVALNAIVLQWGRSVMDSAYLSASSAGVSSHYFIDGSHILEYAPGRFRFINAEGLSLDSSGKFVSNAKKAQVFDDLESARLMAAARMKAERDRAFEKLSRFTYERAADEIVRTYNGIRYVTNPDGTVVDLIAEKGSVDMSQSAFLVQNIPDHRQEEYFAGLLEIFKDYGVKKDFTTYLPSPAKYEEMMARELAPVGDGSIIKMADTIQRRLASENLFAPSTLMDPIARLFRAPRQTDEWTKWIDDYWTPFYAMQKSLMTAQRGPGYIVRNIIGGVWNAYLVGTSARHLSMAQKLRNVEYQTVRELEKKYDDELVRSQAFIETFEENVLREFGQKDGRRLVQAWVSWETLGLRGTLPGSQTIGTIADRGLRTLDVGDYLIDDQRGIMKVKDLPRGTRIFIWGATENPWARVTRKYANATEDWMRLATFLRGADEYGLSDGGVAASMFVKASQFDYVDLSDFEARILRNVIPFYTWTRNNVPLQFRAMMSDPGKIRRALEINAQFADVFGEEEDVESPLPSFVRERFGWTLRPELYETAKGDPLTVGLVWGEPMADINRMFRGPSGPGVFGQIDRLNWREVINMLNPLMKVVTEGITGIEASTGAVIEKTEQAPGWAAPFRPMLRTDGEDYIASSRLLNVARDMIPPLGQLERLFPQVLGNDKYERRQVSQIISTLIGAPASTLDPYQVTGELAARQRRLDSEMRRLSAGNLPERTQFARDLLDIGVTDTELRVLESSVFGGSILEVPIERLNPYATAATVRFMRNIVRLRAAGVPESELDRLLSEFEPPVDKGRRQLSQSLTPEELAQMGLTPNDVARMTPEELEKLLRDKF